MLVFRNSLLVVVIVMVVWVGRSTCGKKNLQPLLLKNFHIYGCIDDKNITKQYIKVKQFGYRHGLYIALSGASTDTTALQSDSSLPCKLPTGVLFFTSSILEGESITITFHRVPENNTKPYGRLETVTREQVDENVDELLTGNNTEGYARPDNVTRMEVNVSMEVAHDSGDNEGMSEECQCNVSISDKFTLHSGYGFIACPDEPAIINKLWREWQETVQEAKKFKALKNKIILAATCGPGCLVIFIILCTLFRLRSSSNDAKLRRRPSTTSGVRTGSTHDHIPINT